MSLSDRRFREPELVDSTVDLPSIGRSKPKERTSRVHAAIQSHVDSDRLGEASIEMVRRHRLQLLGAGG